MTELPSAVREWRDTGRFCDIAGERVFVLDTNSHPGRFVFVLHGFPSSSYDWHLVVPELAKHARVVAFDFLGYGLSAKPPAARYSLFEQADLAVEVAGACGIERCLLVTHDMGQTVGAELAKRQMEGSLPFTIDGVVITNGSTLVDLVQLSPGQRFLLELPDEPLAEHLDVEAFKPGLRDTFSREHQPAPQELDAMLALLRHGDGDLILPRLIRYIPERRANLDRWTSGLADLDAPTTVAWGEQDPIAVVDMARRLAGLRELSDLVIWPDVGHWPSIEVPGRMTQVILDALGR